MGDAGRTGAKVEHARRLAASLAYLMIIHRDAVGLVTFDSSVRAMIPARSAPGHFSVLCNVLEATQTGGETPLNGILHKTMPEHGTGMIEYYRIDLTGRRSQHAADHLPVQAHFLGRSGENAAGDFR